MGVQTSTDPRVGTLLAGRYRIERRLDAGGMATVYRANDEQLGRDVAVKVMHPGLATDPTFTERFRHEAQAAGRLSHPNIAATYDYGADGNDAYIVMELVDGITLRALLDRFGHLDPPTTRHVAGAIAEALEHAHRAGIVHRDVKPENVLVMPDGGVKVVDFGIAKALGPRSAHLTSDGPIGTVAYVAPEQLSGEGVDGRADTWALGAMTYEMLTGRSPMKGETIAEVAAARIHRPTLTTEMSSEIDGAITRATARVPADRFDTPTAFVEALGGDATTTFFRGVRPPVGATQTAPVLPAAPDAPVEVLPFQTRFRRHARRRFRIGAITVLVLTVAAAATYLAIPRPTTVPDVEGQSLEQARAAIERDGLELGDVGEDFHDVIPEGSVISTQPTIGTAVNDGTPIDIVVSKGAQLFDVPTVANVGLDEARNLMTQAGFTLAVASEQHHDTVPDGAVITIDPDIDKAKRGTAFGAIMSLGPPPVAVPDVAGSSASDARAAIEDAGLVYAGAEEYSDDVASGVVIRSEPSGGEAPKGSEITVVVSRGPRPFPMPDLVGSSLEDARAEAAELGLVVRNEYAVPGSDAPVGEVQGQNPPAGTEIQKGSGIDLYHSA